MNPVYPLLLSVSVLLSACGGSSGNTAMPGQAPIIGGAPLVISTTNSKPAARLAYGSTTQSIETGDMVGSGGIASSPVGNFQKTQIEQTISGLVARAARKVPLGPDIQQCQQSGTMTISGELATGLPFSIGDTINVVAAACNDGLGETVSGRMEITITDYSGDILFGPTYRLEMRVLLIDFEVMTATDSIMSNGDSTVTIDTTGTPLITMSISGMAMTTESMTSTEVVSDFLTAQSVDTSVTPGSEPYTLTASGTVNSSQLAGKIVFTTPVTFQGAGAAYPFSGEMLITGANGATIRLIALDAVNVRIETDADGDGEVDPDGTEDTTWADLTS